MTNALAIAPPAPTFATVPVHGRAILAIDMGGGAVRVPMKSFCASLGLPWEPQRKRIQRDPVLREGASIMEVPSAGGVQRQVTLPADLLPGFLMGCEADRFAPELRERVDLFRRECFQVLHAHFAGLAHAGVAHVDLTAARAASAAIATALAATTSPAARRHLHLLLAQTCADLGVEPPPLHAIGAPAPTADQLLGRLFDAVRVLDARKVAWNHARRADPAIAAIVLPELARLFARAEIDFDIGPLRAALEAGAGGRWRVQQKTLTSALTRKPVFAWLIEEWR